MPRVKKATQRTVAQDPIYDHLLVNKFINHVMRRGKKTLAQRHVYHAFEIIRDREKKDPIEIFETAVRNATPQIEVRSRRIGGAAYQVPTPIRARRGTSLSLRWLVQGAKQRPNAQYHSFSEKLAQELLDAARGEGAAFQRKITSLKMAEANKAFAHFRW